MLKNSIITLLLFASFGLTHPNTTSKYKTGDIIFQTSTSTQSTAIQRATKSTYSHCGILVKIGNELVVYEAVEPVKITPLKQWVNHGVKSKYVVKRIKKRDSYFTKNHELTFVNSLNKQFNKHYDIYFNWSDDQLYCSELVWKIYYNTFNLELGSLQKLKEFDLTDPKVATIVKARYGTNIPLEETVISPIRIFESGILDEIK